MSNHSIARLLFSLNLVISIIKRKATLETIAKKIVVDACKSHKSLERKSRAKTLLSSTNVASLSSSPIYTSLALLTTVAKSTITSYTIY